MVEPSSRLSSEEDIITLPDDEIGQTLDDPLTQSKVEETECLTKLSLVQFIETNI